MEALKRAQKRRAEAVDAQEARLTADAARTLRNAERAKEHGLVVSDELSASLKFFKKV